MTPAKRPLWHAHAETRTCRVCKKYYETVDQDPHPHCPKCEDAECPYCKGGECPF